MGALGNGRRGGRSPPLMIAALIACILVLGFNYWVSSSRNLELQTKLYELEGQVRRGAAERGAAEIKKNEFQGEIQRQKEQISHIESFYKRQLEGAQTTCNQEKTILQQNISSSTKTVQELKVQLNQLNDDLGKLQKELKNCQGNINTLNNKLTYDMTHCNSQVLSQKELCEERVAAAKLEVQKKMEKLMSPPGLSPQQGNTETEAVKEVADKTSQGQAATAESQTPGFSQLRGNETSDLMATDIIQDKDVSVLKPPEKDLSNEEPQFDPSAATAKQDVLPPEEEAVRTDEVEEEAGKNKKKNPAVDKDIEVMDTREDGTQTEEADPGMEGMLIGQGKVDETPIGQRIEEPDEYDADEQIVGGVDLEQQQKSKQAENTDKDMEEELADYNGDDENEGEFEADKQAALAQI